jgi:hypothetical protein
MLLLLHPQQEKKLIHNPHPYSEPLIPNIPYVIDANPITKNVKHNRNKINNLTNIIPIIIKLITKT